MSDKKPVLVVGATGLHGGTGPFIVKELLRHGMPVKALVRGEDERSLALTKQGAEVVVGDLRDRRTLIPALDGVELAYFTHPVAEGIVNAAANFASAGRDRGLKRLVSVSTGTAAPESIGPLSRASWLAEELFETSGFDCIILRVAAWFFENLELLHRQEIFGDGVLRSSCRDIPLNWMAGVDAAKLAVFALLQPERFAPKATYFYPTGDDKMTYSEAAAIVGRHLGRKLTYETVSADAWYAHLMELSRSDRRITDGLARQVSIVGASLKEGLPTNELFQSVTGEQPMTLEEALRSSYLTLAL
ncbi:NmrA family NAD(P)-binding protein [Acidicapsa ligni]|uniref:NmrA family NAD(P)-binding protein n=1 Tax=Acidicapsa ligni TaxID=542300 RepID=UPI0021DFA7DC|nr:NAD(P)H-binding protein [Acidicapsa ligni]